MPATTSASASSATVSTERTPSSWRMACEASAEPTMRPVWPAAAWRPLSLRAALSTNIGFPVALSVSSSRPSQ